MSPGPMFVTAIKPSRWVCRPDPARTGPYLLWRSGLSVPLGVTLRTGVAIPIAAGVAVAVPARAAVPAPWELLVYRDGV